MKHNKFYPPIIVSLQGGLGNQLFQLAFAEYLANRHGIIISIDSRSSFWLDIHDKRKYEIPVNILPPSVVLCSFWTSILIAFLRVIRKYNKYSLRIFKFIELIDDAMYAQLEVEKFLHTIKKYHPSRLVFTGWFQDVRYVESTSIARKLLHFLDEYYYQFNRISTPQACVVTCAICLRMYDEANNYMNHVSNGKLPNSASLRNAIQSLSILTNISVKDIHFIFIGQKHYSIFEELGIDHYSYGTPCEGYISALNCLSLISKSDFIIITSSTLYWWGAYLASLRNEPTGYLGQTFPRVFYSNSFTIENVDSLGWHVFNL